MVALQWKDLREGSDWSASSHSYRISPQARPKKRPRSLVLTHPYLEEYLSVLKFLVLTLLCFIQTEKTWFAKF